MRMLRRSSKFDKHTYSVWYRKDGQGDTVILWDAPESAESDIDARLICLVEDQEMSRRDWKVE